MKIFEGDTWADKVNFVDENNVFVGYELGQSCCEDARWFISDKIEETYDPEDADLADTDYEGWLFDRDFFRGEENHMVVFKLVRGDSEKFIHLVNVHNGYYNHGFRFGVDDKVLINDYI